MVVPADADVAFWKDSGPNRKVFEFGKPCECYLSIPSKGSSSVEPAYGRSGPGLHVALRLTGADIAIRQAITN